MKTAAIVNPASASGKTGRMWSDLAPQLPIDRTVFTDSPRHATGLARHLLDQGYERIVAVGGDGTAHEVVNGFFLDGKPVNPDASLAILPLGTGGDFRRSLGIAGLDDAIALIQANVQPEPVDVAHIQYRTADGTHQSAYFANLASFGMGGEVAAGAKNFLKIFGGKAAFLWSTLRVFFTYVPKTADLLVDGELHADLTITNIAVGNGRFHGGGMHVCPLALLDDGMLEVTVIDRLSMFELARDLPVLYSDNVYRHPKVHHFRAKRILAYSKERISIEVDGEPLGFLPVEINVVPGAIRISRR